MTGDAPRQAPAAATPPGAAIEDAAGRAEADAGGLRVVYCGGCNPHIDRGTIASELETAPAFERPDGTVYLSGCPRACASDHQLSMHDPASAVVAGAHVDGTPTPAPDIAGAVRRKLKE